MNQLVLKLVATIGVCFSLALAYANYEMREEISTRTAIMAGQREAINLFKLTTHSYQQLHFAWLEWQSVVEPKLQEVKFRHPKLDIAVGRIINQVRLIEEYSDRLVELGYIKDIKNK